MASSGPSASAHSGHIVNFQRRFQDKILRRIKCHTIRAPRKRPIRVGDTMHLYTGLRLKRLPDGSSPAVLLGRFPCVRVEEIEINFGEVRIAGMALTPDECESLAYHDGFNNFADMMSYWQHSVMPWRGQILYWDPYHPVSWSKP
jgi:hypothetical protein